MCFWGWPQQDFVLVSPGFYGSDCSFGGGHHRKWLLAGAWVTGKVKSKGSCSFLNMRELRNMQAGQGKLFPFFFPGCNYFSFLSWRNMESNSFCSTYETLVVCHTSWVHGYLHKKEYHTFKKWQDAVLYPQWVILFEFCEVVSPSPGKIFCYNLHGDTVKAVHEPTWGFSLFQ